MQPSFMSEGLEARLLMYSYVTIQTPAALPLQVTSGQTVTLTADIRQNDNSDTIQANPTGSVTFFWYPLKETSGPIIGTASNFTVITPYLDTQVTATFSLKSVSSFDGASSDNFGNYDILAGYNGDSNFPTLTSGSGFDNQSLRTAVDPQDRYVPVDFVANATGSIAVTRQPVNTPAGSKFDPPVQVSVLDSAGSVNTSSTASITVALASTSSGTGTLSGTKTVAAVAGVATFTDLTIDKLGQYSFTFSDTSGDTTASGLFNITGGKLVFVQPPKDGTAGEPLNPAVQVALEDPHGAIVSTDSSTVVTLTPIGIKPNPQFSGNSVALVNGVATFSNLILNNPDFYKLQAGDGGDTETTSNRFKIAGDHLVIQHQPAGSDAKAQVPLTIGIYNAANRLDTAATNAVQLSLNPLIPGSTAILGGTITANFVGGVASFTPSAGPTIDTPGRYTFTVTEVEDTTGIPLLGTTTPITTKVFNIGGFHLAFTTKPAAADVDKPLVFSVAAENAHNQIETSLNGDTVQLTLTPTRNGVGGQLSAYNNPGFSSGVETFSAGQSPSIDTPGTYSLTATEIDSTGAIVTTTTPITYKGLKITGYHLVFEVSPRDATIDRPIPMSIEIQDARGAVQTGFDSDFISLDSIPSGSEAYSPVTFSNGRIDFSSTFLDSVGPGSSQVLLHGSPGFYTITASVISSSDVVKEIEPVTSRRFQLSGRHLVFVEQPANTSNGQPIPFTVAVENARGQIDTAENGADIQLTASPETSFRYGVHTFSSGEVTYSVSARDVLGTPTGPCIINGSVGRYTITAVATNPDGTAISDIAPMTSHLFRILPLHLVFNAQPQSIGGGFPIPAFTVGLADASGNPIVDSNIVITVDASFEPVHRGGPSGDLGTATSVDTVAHFNLLHIATPGEYLIKVTAVDAAAGTILSAVSVPITISP